MLTIRYDLKQHIFTLISLFLYLANSVSYLIYCSAYRIYSAYFNVNDNHCLHNTDFYMNISAVNRKYVIVMKAKGVLMSDTRVV